MRRVVALALTAILNAALLGHFYDRFWYPADEGNYAHVAERLLHGEVLNLDVQDIHPGYIDFVNAAAFRAFGVDLVSLRYPLVAAIFVAGCALAWLISARTAAGAVASGIAFVALGVLQFLNPTAHWYSLALTVATVAWLVSTPADRAYRLFGAGVLAGTIVLFRQLTGAWVAMAVLVVLFREQPRVDGAWMSRAILAAMAAVLLAYLRWSHGTTIGGMLVVATWPLVILAITAFEGRGDTRAVSRIIAWVASGGAVAAIPLVAYHAAHGSLLVWVSDTVTAASGLTQLPFFHGGWLAIVPFVGLSQALSTTDVGRILNGVYWGLLPIAPAIAGVLLLRRLRRGERGPAVVLPIVAAFYAVVTLHFDTPTYLYFSVGLSIAAAVWLAAADGRTAAGAASLLAAGLSVVAVIYHAAEPQRTPADIVAGRLMTAAEGGAGLDRCSLRLEPGDRATYGRLVAAIDARTTPADAIFAVPSDAELYFLANRRNRFRFFNSALGVQRQVELEAVLATIADDPPRLVTFRPGDKYNTPASRAIVDAVRTAYDRVDVIDGVEIYTLRRQAAGAE